MVQSATPNKVVAAAEGGVADAVGVFVGAAGAAVEPDGCDAVGWTSVAVGCSSAACCSVAGSGGVVMLIGGIGVELLPRKKATTRRTTTKTAIKIFPKLVVVWLDMFFSLKIKKSLVRIFCFFIRKDKDLSLTTREKRFSRRKSVAD